MVLRYHEHERLQDAVAKAAAVGMSGDADALSTLIDLFRLGTVAKGQGKAVPDPTKMTEEERSRCYHDILRKQFGENYRDKIRVE